MCGIIGLFVPRSAVPPTADLDAALGIMIHRGPDGTSGHRSADGRFQAAFCRLAIIDLETGQQPIAEQSGAKVLLGNGEIYNYVELRRTIDDYPYRTQGDMEAVLAAAHRYGDKFVDHLNGMYALALYDGDAHRLTLVRDRLGVKPLYWAEIAGGGILFASEIKALFATGLVDRAIDEDAVDTYLGHGYVPAPATLFASVRKLPPAHRLTVDVTGAISIERYWRPRQISGLPGEPEELRRHLLDLLEDSVRLQLRSDVAVGTLLSGGIDSGLLVALAARHSAQPLNTFTVSFEGARIDEAPLARAVAEQYATNHTELTISSDHVGDEIIKLAWFAEEPLNDAALLPNYLIEQALGRQVKVAINGTGGDELFAGYGRYFMLPVERRYLRLPLWLRRACVEPMMRAFAPMNAWRLSRAEIFDSDRGAYLHAHTTHFPAPIRRLIGNFMPGRANDQSEKFARYQDETGASADAAMLYADIAGYLPEDLLTLVDRTSMAVGVEGRVPFLDHRLVEAALSVPDEVRMEGRRQKSMERAMARDLLPAEVIEAPKQGFASPVPHWLKSGLAGPARRLLTRPESLERGWWTADGIERLLADPDRHGFRVYSLMMLELAVRLYSEGAPAATPPAATLAEFAE